MNKIKKILLITLTIIISLMSIAPPAYANKTNINNQDKKGQFVCLANQEESIYAVYYDDNGDLHTVFIGDDFNAIQSIDHLAGLTEDERNFLLFNHDYQEALKKMYGGEKIIYPLTEVLVNIKQKGNIDDIAQSKTVTRESAKNGVETNNDDLIGQAIDAVVGIFLWPLRLIPIILGGVIGLILGLFNEQLFLSLQDILFNRLAITDIDFFDFSTKEDTIRIIRQNIAVWYVGIRNLAAVLLVIVCLYVGLRMAMSTLSEEKARYKQMLIDWFTSLCILFVLHYIIIIIIRINNALVNTIGSNLANNNLETVTNDFLWKGLTEPFFTKGMANALIYGILELMTLIFLLTYIKRMITIGFLIVISPLVTVTYSIDRMGDGKSQALNNWFKEFAYNILIQPFQCVTYMAMTSVAVEELKTADIKAAVIAICMISFIMSSEEIIKHIFNFRSESMAKSVASAAVTSSLIKSATSTGGKMFGAEDANESKSAPKQKAGNSGSGKRKGTGPNSSPSTSTSPSTSPSTTPNTSPNSSPSTSTSPSTTPNTSPNTSPSTSPSTSTSTNTTPSTTSSSSSNSNSNSNSNSSQSTGSSSGSKGKKRTLRNIGRAVLGAGIRANVGLAGAVIGLMLGAASGDIQAGITTGLSLASSTNSVGKNINNRRKTGYKKKDLARAFNNYKSANGLTDDQARENGKDLLNGTRVAKTPEEQEYLDSILRMKDQFKANGDDKEEQIEDTENTIDDIADGKISETSPAMTFFGKIKNRGKGTT